MKTGTKMLVAAALVSAQGCAHSRGPDASNPIGKCFGVVGKQQGDCSGKDPATGKSWWCSGKNPTADLGWKELPQKTCDSTPQHAEATSKRFEPFPP